MTQRRRSQPSRRHPRRLRRRVDRRHRRPRRASSERGYVTTGEIFAALPKLEPETAELAAIYARIDARGVEVVDEIDEELRREDERRAGAATSRRRATHLRRPPRRRRRRLAAASGRGRRRRPRPHAHAAAAAAERVEGGSFDPVRMYLKEIGKVPLLTGQQEVTLAQRIEAGVHATERLETPPRALRRSAHEPRSGRHRRRDGEEAAHRGEPAARWCRSPSATSVAAWRCSTSCRRATSA